MASQEAGRKDCIGPPKKVGCTQVETEEAQAAKGIQDPRWPGRGARGCLVSVGAQKNTRGCLCVNIGSERKQKKPQLTQSKGKMESS